MERTRAALRKKELSRRGVLELEGHETLVVVALVQWLACVQCDQSTYWSFKGQDRFRCRTCGTEESHPELMSK